MTQDAKALAKRLRDAKVRLPPELLRSYAKDNEDYWFYEPKAVEAVIAVLEASSPSALIAAVEADLKKARVYLSNGAGCYEMEDINYSIADHIRTLKSALAAFDKAIADLKLLRAAPTEEVA